MTRLFKTISVISGVCWLTLIVFQLHDTFQIADHKSGKPLEEKYGSKIQTLETLIQDIITNCDVTSCREIMRIITKAQTEILRKRISGRPRGLGPAHNPNANSNTSNSGTHHTSNEEIPQEIMSRTEKGSPDVCPERYFNADCGSGTCFKGFEIQNCSGVPKFHTILTLVYNFVHYSSADLQRVPGIILSVNKLYPKIKIIAAVPTDFRANLSSPDVEVSSHSNKTPAMILWSFLISRVQTKYVYIGRNVAHFTEFDRLERLVRQISSLNVTVVGSAVRGYMSGRWSTGCSQSILRNYTLVYRHGYERSEEECLFCDHIQGPFAAKTQLFKQIAYGKISATSSFAHWFLKLKAAGKQALVCPDSMSFVTDESNEPTKREDWLDLVRKLQIERVYLPLNRVFEYTCHEAYTRCAHIKGKKGVALSPCCMKALSDSVQVVIKKFEEVGILYELIGGTLLGAVKLNAYLPWEIDADLLIHPNNRTAFIEQVKPYLNSQHFKVESYDNNMTQTAEYRIFAMQKWKIEVLPWSFEMGSIKLTSQGLSPTTISLDGKDMVVMESPGLYARNQYGFEVYRHAPHFAYNDDSSRLTDRTHTYEQGQFSGCGQTGKYFCKDIWTASSYIGGKFLKCPQQGSHFCLDQYSVDGNLQFNSLGIS